MNRSVYIISRYLLLSALLPIVCLAQSGPADIPQPPTAELGKFSPFFGRYNVTSDFSGAKFSGDLEVKSAVKGWYVELVFLVNAAGGVDRELRILATWDRNAKKYRTWRFESLPAAPQIEGDARFEENNLVMEFKVLNLDGSQSLIRNWYTMVSINEIQVVTEVMMPSGETRRVGVTAGKRVKQG